MLKLDFVSSKNDYDIEETPGWQIARRADYIAIQAKEIFTSARQKLAAEAQPELPITDTLAGRETSKVLNNLPEKQALFRGNAYSLVALQEWEGCVESVESEEFTATLTDKTDPKNPAERATFNRGELSTIDQELLKEGAIFRWTIGYQKSASGVKQRVSQIVFRRMPTWSLPEIKSAKADANKILESFIWE